MNSRRRAGNGAQYRCLSRSKETAEHLDRQSGLPDDGAQRATAHVPARVHGDDDNSSWIGRMNEHVMTPTDTLNNEAGLLKRADDLAARNDRKSRVHNASVSVRIVGDASSGTAMPWSRRYPTTSLIASAAIAIASSSVSPSVTISGNDGTVTVNPPSG